MSDSPATVCRQRCEEYAHAKGLRRFTPRAARASRFRAGGAETFCPRRVTYVTLDANQPFLRGRLRPIGAKTLPFGVKTPLFGAKTMILGTVGADDPARIHCGCFVPDLTKFASAPSADSRCGLWRGSSQKSTGALGQNINVPACCALQGGSAQ